MKNQHYLLLILSLFILQSCSSQKQIMWVSGYQTDCDMGAGRGKCLQVSTQKKLEKANWQTFYDGISGFNYEPGYLKKIEVKKEILDAKNVPADASTIKYILVKELDKQIDNRTLISGDWILGRIEKAPINRMMPLPTLSIDLNFNRISGNGGCNTYGATIQNLSQDEILFNPIEATLKACINKNIEGQYFEALNKVASYEVANDELTFYDENGNELLFFIKKNETTTSNEPNQRLHDIWVAVTVNQKAIASVQNRPRLEINLGEKKVMGYDGCNNYQGEIRVLDDTHFELDPKKLVSTEKYCPDNKKLQDDYMTALLQARTYTIAKMNLIFYDAEGRHVLELKKVD